MHKYSEASTEVIHMAEELIGQYHPALEEARIAFVFLDEATETDGRTILGTTTKVSPKMKPFMKYDFLIMLAEDRWTSMSRPAREALIDHELCHCGGDSLNGWRIHHHDFEEFYEVIRRHGAWKADLFKLQSIMQPGLPGTEAIPMTKDRGKVATLSGEQLALLSKKTPEDMELSKKVEDFRDELLEEARRLKAETGEITISVLQRKLRIGYGRAARILELIETANGQ